MPHLSVSLASVCAALLMRALPGAAASCGAKPLSCFPSSGSLQPDSQITTASGCCVLCSANNDCVGVYQQHSNDALQTECYFYQALEIAALAW